MRKKEKERDAAGLFFEAAKEEWKKGRFLPVSISGRSLEL